jgi:hemerythrin
MIQWTKQLETGSKQIDEHQKTMIFNINHGCHVLLRRHRPLPAVIESDSQFLQQHQNYRKISQSKQGGSGFSNARSDRSAW